MAELNAPDLNVFSTGVFERPGSVLIIDDNKIFAEGIAEILSKEYHSVSCAYDAHSGFTSAQENKPELILLDIVLPGATGYEVCRRIKSDPELRYTPVVLITGLHSEEAHLLSLQAGASDFLLKPIDPPVLKARVAAWLKYRRAVSALRNTNKELERRVAARTAELSAANESLLREVAHRREVETALRESQERYALAARGANDGLWDWNLESGEIYFSPRWKAMSGREHEELNRVEKWLEYVHPEDTGALRGAIDAHIQGISPQLRCEYRILYKDGTYRWMVTRGLVVRDDNGKPVRMAGSQTDITERKLAEQQLLHNAFHDELSGLPNRALFLDRLGQALKRTKLNEHLKLGVLFLDIDRFKIINDSLGFRTGNQLLIEFGRRLRSCLPATSTVARLAGDEFAVLLEDIKTLVEATAIAESIHEALRRPFKLSEREVYVTTSVGIVVSKQEYDRAEDMLRDSETAMHQAKAMGNARQETFHSGMHAQVLTLLHLEHDLRHAVEARQFFLEYQPIVKIPDGKLAHFEALLRWKHPIRGVISPGEFIPLAEETELITPMTFWVIGEACRQLREWREKHPTRQGVSVSINVSGPVLQESLVGQIAEILKEHAVSPDNIKLELTEQSVMAHAESTAAVLTQLRAMKMELHIDDFGTGYSSLSHLHRLPVDVLKIDRSFISNMELADKNRKIIRTIMTLASNLDMKVTAEGVETEQQLAILKELGCHYAQGYFYSRPISAAAAEVMLQKETVR